ncbi:hypothetical protein XO10_05390 [Marinitoga sp. 1135]|uniref:hypothetical protein n=1 Tax=Marinitoga TaxID=160798 RepID=UPI000310DB3D|nr:MULTISPECIES: hypothetical protein [Marinitoga]APT75969.1 hypothetical protein LN42_05945 [Marinitoga sp. 1137]NUU95709.1 hypothetical protein [Marinitoga sp. 1135]NUU97641.1 hypothetical protein [Marinitoga sp. 1138]
MAQRKKFVVGKKKKEKKKLNIGFIIIYIAVIFVILYFSIQMVRMFIVYSSLTEEYKKTQSEFENLKEQLKELEKERDMIKEFLEKKGVTLENGKINYNNIPQTIEGTNTTGEATR